MATASRADEVRARRTQRREEKPILGRLGLGMAKAVAETPRMVARNPHIERKLQAANEGRRRHYLKLGEAGAELRLPSLPSVHVGWRLISGLIFAVCSLALYAMSTANFTVSRVELRGAERVDANAINSALRVAGTSIFTVKADTIYEILVSQFPELEHVSVHVGLPGRVVVDVQEREPLISWQQAGLTVWIDASGVAFIPQQDGAGLIQVEALEPPPPLDSDAQAHHRLIRPEMVTAIQALSRIAPQGAPLIYDPKLGFGWNDPGGWQAFFGQDGKDIDQRLAVYLNVLNELKTRRLIPTLISVAQLHAPYYRMDY